MMHRSYTSTDDINVQKGFEYFKNLVFATNGTFPHLIDVKETLS